MRGCEELRNKQHHDPSDHGISGFGIIFFTIEEYSCYTDQSDAQSDQDHAQPVVAEIASAEEYHSEEAGEHDDEATHHLVDGGRDEAERDEHDSGATEIKSAG